MEFSELEIRDGLVGSIREIFREWLIEKQLGSKSTKKKSEFTNECAIFFLKVDFCQIIVAANYLKVPRKIFDPAYRANVLSDVFSLLSFLFLYRE